MLAKNIHPDFNRQRISPHFVYESYDEQTGFFHNKGSVGFVLMGNPMNGAELAAEDEVAEFIKNTENLPDGASLQVLMIGSSDISFLLERWRLERQGEVYEALAQSRCNFLASAAKAQGNIKNVTILISVAIPDKDTCLIAMERRREALKASLANIYFWAFDINDEQLQGILSRIWNGDPAKKACVNPYELLSEQIVSTDFGLFESADRIEFADGRAAIALEVEPRSRPKSWQLGLMDLFLGNEMRKSEYIQTDFLIHVGLQVLENQGIAKAAAYAKRESLHKNIAAGLDKFFPDLREEEENLQGAIECLQANDRMIHLHMHVVLIGDKEKVGQAATDYMGIMRRSGFGFANSRYDHLAVLLSSMPMSLVALTPGFFKPKIGGMSPALIGVGRGIRTVSSETKALLPLVGEYKGDLNSPCLMLVQRRGQLMYWSPFGSEFTPHLCTSGSSNSILENYNCVIAGNAGSGKSVAMQDLMLSVLGIGGKAFVLDYGKSFERLCKIVGGNYIEFDVSRPISINPFSDVPMGNDQLSTEARADFLATFPTTLATMAAPKLGTSDIQDKFLKRALDEVWKEKRSLAQIDDIASWLLRQNESVATELGHMLYDYTASGAYGAFFSGKANVSLNSNIVVIETDHLRNFPDLMAVVIQIMITHINHTMAKGSVSKPNLLLIDEMTKTLKNPLALKFGEETVRIVRKYKASVVVGTQLVTDFHTLGKNAEAIFTGASHKLIFRQSADTLNLMRSTPMFEHYVKTDNRLRRMMSVESKKGRYSECSIWGPDVNGIIARLYMDPFSLLMMSTNPTDKTALAEKAGLGLNLVDSITAVLQERGLA